MGSLVKIRKYHGLGNDFLVLLDVEGHRGYEDEVLHDADGPQLCVASGPIGGFTSNRQAGLGTHDADGPQLRVASSPIGGFTSNRQAGLGTPKDPSGLNASGISGDAAAALARAACSRHRGIGADGMLIVTSGPADGSADITMRLHNADGSIAEMSGNGIRCFSQAVVDSGLAPAGTLRVQTDAGLRVVEVGATDARGIADIRVDMGKAKVDEFEIPAAVRVLVEALGDSSVRIATVDVGNPHLVVGVDGAEIDVASFDIAAFGTKVEEHFVDAFGGINVHVVARRSLTEQPSMEHSTSSASHVDVLDMTIWERGVGITEACGTGATAVAVAAHGWGWVGLVCELRQPGGTARVEIAGEQLTLIGPSQFVAVSDFAWNQ
jgi:diaminopimelate epimerase